MNMVEMLFQTLQEIYYLILGVSSGSFPRKLTAAEEAELITRKTQGDAKARAELIEHNLRLVAHIVRKYHSGLTDSEDMLSIGTIGLIKAVDTYQADKGTRFSSYAARCIENECLMSLRASKKSALDVSISEPIDTDSHGNELTLLDVISCDDTIADDLDSKLRCERLRAVMADMPDDREMWIIKLRYGLDGKKALTQKEIASMFGISRSYVSRIEKKALERLKEKF